MFLAALLLPLPALAADTVINTSPTVYDSTFYSRVFVYDQGCTESSCSSSPTLVDVIDPTIASEFWIYGQSQMRFLGGSVAVARVHQDSVVELLGTDMSVQVRDRALALLQTGSVGSITLEGNLTDTTRLEINGGHFSTVYGNRITDITMNAGLGTTMDLQGWWAGSFTMNGGTIQNLWVAQQSLPIDAFVFIHGGTVANGFQVRANTRFIVTGGNIPAPIAAYYSGWATLRGGSGITELRTFGLVDEQDALIEVMGTDFAVDGAPVPYGDIAAQSGILTGTLADGSPLSASFLTNGADPNPPTNSGWYGTIRLMPAPEVPSASPVSLAALVAVLVGTAIGWAGPGRANRRRGPGSV